MNRNHANVSQHGKLTIVGSGIAAVSHMTLETIMRIEAADVVFFHATNGVTARHIQQLRANIVDLYGLYEEEKIRKITYIQMAELMLREVRAGKNVVGVFHGHPGCFVLAARRALSIADMEGYKTELLPGISTIDCVMADLRIDPGVNGMQILKAGCVLTDKLAVATQCHVLLLQIGSVGERDISFSGRTNEKNVQDLFERLIELYSPDHECIYYFAPLFPDFEPTIKLRQLSEYLDPEVARTVHTSTLYLPPKGHTVASVKQEQAFGKREIYGRFETKAIEQIDDKFVESLPITKMVSDNFFNAMRSLATDPTALRTFREKPAEFVSRLPNLTAQERAALFRKNTGAIRALSKQHKTLLKNSGQQMPLR